MPFHVDHRPRIEFYVRNGLLSRAPSDEQLREATRLNLYGAGVVERLRFYASNPLQMLPTRAKLDAMRRTNQQVAESGVYAETREPVEISAVQGDFIDRALAATLLISPIRLGVQTLFNPWAPIPTSGLNIPAKYLISHLVHAPHPTAVWDMQILHPDEGALELLEHEIDRAESGRGVRSRVFRAMAQRPGYYDYLRGLLPRIRRFDYPPTPPGYQPVLENLVVFLNHAAQL